MNTTRIAKISANLKNGSNHKYFAGEGQVQESPELTQRRSNIPMQNTTGRCKRNICCAWAGGTESQFVVKREFIHE